MMHTIPWQRVGEQGSGKSSTAPRVPAFHKRISLLVLTCSTALLFTCPAARSASDWPTFQHDPQHTGVSADAKIAVPMRVCWRFATNGPIRAQPVIKGGIAYFGSTDHKFYALDAESGRLKWSFITGGEVIATASVDNDGAVYFGCDDGFVYALDAKTGALRWKSPVCRMPPTTHVLKKASYWRIAFRAAKERRKAGNNNPLPPANGQQESNVKKDGVRPPWAPDVPMAEGGLTKPTSVVIRAPVLAARGMVFVGAGLAGSWGYMHGFDAKTGKLLWKLESSEPGAYRHFGGAENGPVIYRNSLFWPSYQHQILALDPASGKTRAGWPVKPVPITYDNGIWPCIYQVKTGSQMAVNEQGIAVVAGASLGYSQRWVAIDLSNHAVLSNKLGPTTRVHRSAPLLKGNLLYSTTFRVVEEEKQPWVRTASIVCFDMGTRKQRSEFETEEPREPFNRCLAMAGGLVFGVTGDGRIYAVREDLGKQVWAFDLKTPVKATAAIAQGMYFIGTEDGRMYAFGK